MRRTNYLFSNLLSVFCILSLVAIASSCRKPSFVIEESQKSGDSVVRDQKSEDSLVRDQRDPNKLNQPQEDPLDPTNPGDPQDPSDPTDPTDPSDPDGSTVTFEQTFPAGIIGESSITFKPQARRATQDITMVKADPRDIALNQITRPRYSETFFQGHDGKPYQQSFRIQEGKLLDLLLVVDDSSSMTEKQRKVAERLSPLVSSLQGVNWQIGVVSTTSSCLQQQKILKSTDLNPSDDFKNIVEGVGVSGNDVEMGVKLAVRGLAGECESTPQPRIWIRENSTVAVLLVADEDNCGKYESAFSPQTTDTWQRCLVDPEGGDSSYLVNYLKSIRPPKPGSSSLTEGARVYGIYWDPNNASCDSGGTFGQVATKYAKAVSDTNGLGGCIYAPDYTNIMKAVSNDVSSIVQTQFALAAIPDLGTLVVKIDNKEIKEPDFEIRGKILTLKKFDPAAQIVDVIYVSGAVPRTSIFPLAAIPISNAVFVQMKDPQGQAVDPGNFMIQSKPNAIVFETLPPDSAQIQVAYIEDKPLLTEFSLGSIEIENEPLAVTVGGVPTADYQYDLVQNRIVFPSPPAESTKIVVTYQTPYDIVTQYSALSNASQTEKITSVDLVSGLEVPVILKNQWLIFQKEDVINGRKIRVTYDYGIGHNFAYILPAEPLPNTVVVTVEENSVAIGSCQNVHTVGSVVLFECKEEFLPEIQIDYQYAAQEFRQFTIEITDPAIQAKLTPVVMAKARWQVSTENGDEITEYSVRDKTVFLSANVAVDPDEKIRIILTAKIQEK